jgi:hypothetical protein
MVYKQKHIDSPMSLLESTIRRGGRYVQYYFDMDGTSLTVFPDFYDTWNPDFSKVPAGANSFSSPGIVTRQSRALPMR